jgi:hypothetical protein
MSAALIPWRHLRRITVSTVFYDAVFKYFPLLRKRSDYQSLFWYICFGAHFDRDSKNLLLCSKHIAEIVGREPANFPSGKFLSQFGNDVLGEGNFVWCSGWREKHCRQLLKIKFGGFTEVYEAEKRHLFDEKGRVYLNGEAFSASKRKELKNRERKEAEFAPVQCGHAKFIQRYLNSLDSNLFTKTCKQNYRAAFDYAVYEYSGAQLHREHRILRHIAAQPQPFYSASPQGNTVRLFTSVSIPDLKRDVRQVFTRGWLDGDLRCSQLSICAWLWKITPIMKFLQSGQSVWNYFFAEMGIPGELFARAKPVIKEALYSVCYGMQMSKLRGFIPYQFACEEMPKEFGQRFLAVPLVQTLLDARRVAQRRVIDEGKAETCYGKILQLKEGTTVHSILAQQAQSLEMYLIFPAFALADKTADFKILLFQYDGFSVHFTSHPERWRKRIKFIVDEQAKHLGIPTWLEWDETNPVQSEFTFAQYV